MLYVWWPGYTQRPPRLQRGWLSRQVVSGFLSADTGGQDPFARR